MRKGLLAGLGVVVLTTSMVDAQTPGIDHQPVGCAVAERFPRLEARFAPADTVAAARVLFQPENGQHWYAVAMKPAGFVFAGVLPKPKKSLKAFRYYIEVTDRALGTNRTADYTTSVVADASGCKGKVTAAAIGSASVLLQVPAGAAALPAGFASTGVVAAGSGSAVAATGAAAGGGGGLGTGAIAGIVAGAGAVAAGAVVAASKSGGGSSAHSYTGPFNGTLTVSYAYAGGTCSTTHALTGTLILEIGGGQGDAGYLSTGGSKTQIAGATGCPSSGNFSINFAGSVTGTPGRLSFKLERVESNGFGYGIEFSGAVNGGSLSGTLTSYYVAGATVAGSVDMPVTLR